MNTSHKFSVCDHLMALKRSELINTDFEIDNHICGVPARLPLQARLCPFNCFPPRQLSMPQIVVIFTAAFPHLTHSLKYTLLWLKLNNNNNSNQPNVWPGVISSHRITIWGVSEHGCFCYIISVSFVREMISQLIYYFMKRKCDKLTKGLIVKVILY